MLLLNLGGSKIGGISGSGNSPLKQIPIQVSVLMMK